MGNCLVSEVDDQSCNPTSSFVNPTTSSLLFSSVSSSSGDQSQVFNTTIGVAVLNGEVLPTPNLKKYNYAELQSATRGFKHESMLGVGGFGTVYKGWVDERTLAPSTVDSGIMVAIKKLNKGSLQGFQDWQSEVNLLGRLSHPNLVTLLGYCWDNEEMLLVNEFVPGGSLEGHLFKRDTIPLSWDVRLKIAIGAARGLAFLHSLDKAIIYRDFKTSSILLDKNYNAKIVDFGLARLGPSGDNTHVSAKVIGSYGYADPEYLATGHLYVKSDVYGFGAVLFEILTGLRVFDPNRPIGQRDLLEGKKAQLSKKQNLESFMDARMKGQYSVRGAHLAALLTLRCVESIPKNRPSMKEVLEALEQIRIIQEKTSTIATGIARFFIHSR